MAIFRRNNQKAHEDAANVASYATPVDNGDNTLSFTIKGTDQQAVTPEFQALSNTATVGERMFKRRRAMRALEQYKKMQAGEMRQASDVNIVPVSGTPQASTTSEGTPIDVKNPGENPAPKKEPSAADVKMTPEEQEMYGKVEDIPALNIPKAADWSFDSNTGLLRNNKTRDALTDFMGILTQQEQERLAQPGADPGEIRNEYNDKKSKVAEYYRDLLYKNMRKNGDNKAKAYLNSRILGQNFLLGNQTTEELGPLGSPWAGIQTGASLISPFNNMFLQGTEFGEGIEQIDDFLGNPAAELEVGMQNIYNKVMSLFD